MKRTEFDPTSMTASLVTATRRLRDVPDLGLVLHDLTPHSGGRRLDGFDPALDVFGVRGLDSRLSHVGPGLGDVCRWFDPGDDRDPCCLAGLLGDRPLFLRSTREGAEDEGAEHPLAVPADQEAEVFEALVAFRLQQLEHFFEVGVVHPGCPGIGRLPDGAHGFDEHVVVVQVPERVLELLRQRNDLIHVTVEAR